MKKLFFLLIFLAGFNAFSQNPYDMYDDNPGSCFTVTKIGNLKFKLTSIRTAQCADCYHWSVSPTQGVHIIGSSTKKDLLVQFDQTAALNYYTFSLTLFNSSGYCSSCSKEIYITGPCGCADDCRICFDAEEIHYFSPHSNNSSPNENENENINDLNDHTTDFEGGDNLNEAAGLSVTTTIGNNCDCIDYIEYNYENLDGHHSDIVDRNYWRNHNQYTFEIFAPRDQNISYQATIHFINSHYTVEIDGYHVQHGDIDHDDDGTRHDCWTPRDGVVSSRPQSSSNFDKKEEFKLYPNPTKNRIKIKYIGSNLNKYHNLKVVITNSEGIKIYDEKIKNYDFKNDLTLELNKIKIKNGIYTLFLMEENKVIKTFPVILQ